MKKILDITNSCSECPYCMVFSRPQGNTIRQAIVCGAANSLLLMAWQDRERGPLDIPDWCPLETYTPDAATKAGDPPTVTLCGLDWMTEPLTGHGGTEKDGRWYYTQDEALKAAKQVGGGWRLPTKEEHVALAALSSTWVEEGPHGLPGRWFGGNHATDHRGSIFFEASGCRASNSGGLFDVGTGGFSWSSSPCSSSRMGGSSLGFSSGSVGPETSDYRAYGFPVRLVREAR